MSKTMLLKRKMKEKTPVISRARKCRSSRFLAALAVSFAARRKTMQMPTPLCGISRRKLPGYVSRG